MNINKHGLSRDIPEHIKRKVRKHCGFGCVVCGSAIYEYEHFAPEFKDAKEHKANGIALLCPTDHRRKEKKLLSKQKYLNAIANPKALETKKAYTEWENSTFAPIIVIGNKIFKDGTSIIQIDDELLLGFKEPEEDGSPPRLYSRFFDSEQREVFSIVDNQIQIHSDSFDVETKGNNWVVRSKLYNIDLDIQLNPPNMISIKKLNFSYKKWSLKAKGREFELLYNEKPNLLMSGPVLIKGPCLFNLSGKGKVVIKDMIFEGLGTPPKNKSNNTLFKWPLYLYIDAEPNTPIQQVVLATTKGANILPLFTSEKSAKRKGSENIPSNFKIHKLGSKGLTNLLEQVAIPKGITIGILDPDLNTSFQKIDPFDLKQFIDNNKNIILDDDPCLCQSGKKYKDCHGKL